MINNSKEKIEKSVIKNSNSIIYISNNFIDSVHKFSMSEQRILWYFLRFYKFNKLSTVSLDMVIKHNEYAILFNMSTQQAAGEIASACLSLTKNMLYIPRPEWENNVIDCLEEKILTRDELDKLLSFQASNIVDTCKFGIRRNESEIMFTSGFLKLILPLKNDIFTQYRLLQAKSIPNALHVALYEEFRRWVKAGFYKITPIRLINKLQLPHTYELYSQMRRGFIEPAIKSINNKTDLNIKLKEQRINPENPHSKVINLIFSIEVNNIFKNVID